MKQGIFPIFFLFVFGNITGGQLNIYLNAGMSYSTIRSNNNFDVNPKYGMALGLNSYIKLNDRFFLTPEINITQKGAVLVAKNNQASDYFMNKDVKLTYLEVPLTLNMNLLKYKSTTTFCLVGLYGCYNIWTKDQTRETLDLSSTMDGPGYPYDFGFAFGIGIYIYENFIIKYRYNPGFKDIFDYRNESYTNQCQIVTLGYRFIK